MFTTDDIKDSTNRFDELISKRSRPRDPSDSPVAYQSLSVVKKLAKAKFPVYLTSSKINQQNYAMKIFSHHEGKPHPYFNNEIRFASLKHPNVVNMVHYENERDAFDKGEVKRVSYILMEYAPYGDFFDFITKHGSCLDEKLIRTFFRELISGIEYLHASGIAHLDLKPENLLLGADFNLKITDFDLSHVRGDTKVLSRGTKYYRGPEFFKSGSSDTRVRVSFAADIYSAGIILFILKCAGVYPHCEEAALEGINLSELMYSKNEEFWKTHCKIQGKRSSFFDKSFKELFNNMVKCNPEERISIQEIKKSKWYNGPIYNPTDFQKKMKKILKV